MKTEDQSYHDKSEIAHEILAYLVSHPEASDTIDGIVQWWFLEQAIKIHMSMLQEILEELVLQGLLIERKGNNLHPSYKINKDRYPEIKEILSQGATAGKTECRH